MTTFLRFNKWLTDVVFDDVLVGVCTLKTVIHSPQAAAATAAAAAAVAAAAGQGTLLSPPPPSNPRHDRDGHGGEAAEHGLLLGGVVGAELGQHGREEVVALGVLVGRPQSLADADDLLDERGLEGAVVERCHDDTAPAQAPAAAAIEALL